MLHEDIKKAVDNNDVKTLKYNFCDCLDGDPIFEKSREDYEYCKSKGVLFVPHEDLHKMSLDSVDDSYWLQLKKDFMINPSVERFEHMIEAAKIFYKERIERIEKNKLERERKRIEQEELRKKREERLEQERLERERLERERLEREKTAVASSSIAGDNDDGVRRVSERRVTHDDSEKEQAGNDSGESSSANFVGVVVGAIVFAVIGAFFGKAAGVGEVVGILVGAFVGATAGAFLGSKFKQDGKSS